MDIRVKRRLSEVDGFVIHIIEEHYKNFIFWMLSTGRSANDYEYSVYRNSVISTSVTNILHYFSHKQIICASDSEIESQLKDYIESKYTNKICEEFYKMRLKIQSKKQYEL